MEAKKNWFLRHKILTGLLVLVVIGVIGAAAGGGGEKKEAVANSSNDNQAAALEAKQEEAPVVVDAKAFVAEFDANKIAAQDKYKDKIVQTSGWVKNISGGDFGGIYIVVNPVQHKVETYGEGEYAITSTTEYYGTAIQCYVEKEDAAALTNGQQVTIKGKVNDMSFTNVQVKDCKVVK